MGEKEKRLGELGEKVVSKILNKIGWSYLQNFDIPCIYSEKHKTSKNDRRTHGIDFLSYLKNPLINDYLETVIISSKYREQYKSELREFLTDISTTTECLRKNKDYKHPLLSGKKHAYCGVVFWLAHGEDPKAEINTSETEFRFRQEIKYDYTFLVDNKRANFLIGAIDFANSLASDAQTAFYYQDTGLNVPGFHGRDISGSQLPLNLINSRILPFKLSNQDGDTLLLTIMDDFHINNFLRLLGLVQNMTHSWANRIIISFPDYHHAKHQSDVDKAVQRFADRSFQKKLSVNSFQMGDFKRFEEE